MKKTVLVTGGAGFIASHIVDEYINLGYKVAILDNLSSGSLSNVNSQAKLYTGDITDLKQVKATIAEVKPHIINHHAAHLLVGDSVHHPQYNAEVNIIGLLNIMEEARKYNLEKVVMASTGGAMYGNQVLPFNETMKEAPLSPYGVSKRASELYLRYYYEQYGIPFIILRYSNVYGPRQNSHGESGVIAIFSDLISNNKQPIINGDGTQTRDFVFVKDVVKANMLATNNKYIGELNIGTNTEIAVNELFDVLQLKFNTDLKKQYGPERPGEQKESRLDYSLAKTVLQWEPTVSLEEGIEDVVRWYRKQQ